MKIIAVTDATFAVAERKRQKIVVVFVVVMVIVATATPAAEIIKVSGVTRVLKVILKTQL